MKRILTVLAAVTAFASIGAAPALASQPAPAQPAGAHAATAVPMLRAGDILCSEDLCLQTLSINGPPNCNAVVREWPYTVNLYGHLEIAEPYNHHYFRNSTGGDHWWRAGIDGYNFTIPYFSPTSETEQPTNYGDAWQRNNPGRLPANYSIVGEVQFGIIGPYGC